LWFTIVTDFPKLYRYTLGGKIENSFLEMLEHVFTTIYLPPEQKLITLSRAITKLNSVQFFLQIAWENKCISSKHYTEISADLEEIGRMLGGWKKGLQTKTPAKR
jgi:hypothetical protein